MTRFLFIAPLLMFTLVSASALPTAAREAREKLSVRFVAERAPQELGPVLVAAGDAKGKPFELTTTQLSEAQEPPARAFQLRALKPDVPLAQVTLPEAGKAFVVLLIPAPQGGYTPVAMAAGDPAFKGGDTYFYNHTSKTVLGFVGTAKFVLKPAAGQVLRPAGAKPENYYEVGFGIREEGGDRPLSATRWPVDASTRSYVFFFENPTTKRVDYRAVDEFVGAPKGG